MSFLAPLFLLALGALAVPVLIHLTQRERKQIVQFPSLMFLQRIPYPSVRRRRIRNWALLLLRLAALALIVAAFARPFVRRPAVALAGSAGPREVVFLLDCSYSMGYGDHWERARGAVRQAVGGLAAADRATLILFGTGAELAVRSTTDRAPLLAALDAARTGWSGTRYGPALKLAERILVESPLPRREVILVTDYQKTGWNRGEELRLPEGAVLTPVSVAEPRTSNVTVSSVMLQRAALSGLDRLTVSAGLVNGSGEAVSDLQVQLEVDGRRIQVRSAALPPNGSASVAFEPFTLPGPHTRGTVRIAPDRLPADDTFHFVVSPVQPLGVLVVEPDRAARDASLYLTRALAIGTTPPYRADVKPAGQVVAADFEGSPASGSAPRVAILNDVAPAGPPAGQLRRFVERGGGLLVVLGERAAWTDDARDLLPGRPGASVDQPAGRGGLLGELDYGHPIFELFKTPGSGDFSTARFFRYRAVAVDPAPEAAPGGGPAGDRTSVLARFDDGAPALTTRAVGQGRVVMWSSTLDNVWNDVVLKPVFLPFLHQLIRYLARYQEPSSWLTVGQVLDTDALMQGIDVSPRPSSGAASARPEARGPAAGAVTRAGVVLTPSGRRIEATATDRGGPLELTEAGFYEIRPRTGEPERPLAVAANLDRFESDLSSFDPRDLAAAVAARPDGARPTAGAIPVTAEEQERRQAVWWYLLLAGLAILAVETVVSNRLSRTG